MNKLLLLGLVLHSLYAIDLPSLFSTKIEYTFSNEPIDVMIPAVEKDLPTLELCIQSLQQNVTNLRRIIVVSAHRLTHLAEWFDESLYPFTLYDIGYHIHHEDVQETKKFATENPKKGWIYQQFLKLYASFVIPNISSNLLVVDADVVLFRPITFTNELSAGLYNNGVENYRPYFEHMERLLPGLHRAFPEYSGITHHMLFQRPVLEDLFSMIEQHHQCPPWQAICRCIDPSKVLESCLSEYEIYFNFVFARTNQVTIRKLNWSNLAFSNKENLNHPELDYGALHSYMRN
jgi:hypothetical protein